MDTDLDPEVTARIDRYWADQLGCLPGEIRQAGVTVATIPPDRSPGIAVLDRGESRIVSGPSEWVEDIPVAPSALADLDPEGRDFAGQIGVPVAGVLGPQYMMYATSETFRPVHDANTRPIERGAAPALKTLRKACGETWETRAGDIGFESHDTLVGRFIGDELAAVGAYRAVTDSIARVTAITHPDHRNRGFGTAAASGAATEALADGFVADCRPLAGWETAVDVGNFLGFVRYGTAWRVVLG